MTKTLYEFEIAISYNDESTEPDICSGYVETYKDALKSAFIMADAIAPEKAIISIKKKGVDDDKDTY